jgi:hypothetical protein
MDVRASDADRDATVNRLREAAAEGRLTLEELTDRIEAAGNAVMRSDLLPLTSDLPATAAVGIAMQPAGARGVSCSPAERSSATSRSATGGSGRSWGAGADSPSSPRFGFAGCRAVRMLSATRSVYEPG